jgi:hypothetical protein
MPDQQHLAKLRKGVNAWNEWRKEHPEIMPDLRRAELHDTSLCQIDFRHTNLAGANFHNTNLSSANLSSARLWQTDLSEAKLRDANLYRACFKETNLQRTNFHKACLLDTMFLNVNLSEAINLETVIHLGPSTIGIDTIQRSRGRIPDMFLYGAGVSEQFLKCIHASGRDPFDYYTCFISYCSVDKHFVDVLYRDLRKEGVPCWYAPESLRGGEKFPVAITEAVQSREKLLVVLSKNSLKSDWVETEVQIAREKEGGGKREVLLPIRLDSAILDSSIHWAAAIRKRRHIRSFESWRQPSNYQKMLKELLDDLHK